MSDGCNLGADKMQFGVDGRDVVGQSGSSTAASGGAAVVDLDRGRGAGQLLDVVEGRDAAPAARWLAERDPAWRAQIRWATLDMSGPYRAVFDTMLSECDPGRGSVPPGASRRAEA
jgi:hypothetical protein